MYRTLKNVAMGVIVIALTLLTGCNSMDEVCYGCNGVKPDVTEQVTFYLMNKSISSEFNIYKFERDSNHIESASSTNVDEKLCQLFSNYCANKNLVFNDEVMGFVVYYNSLVSQSLSITDDNIKGISVYTVKGRKITHSLYLRDGNNNFYEEENVRVRVPAITINHIYFYFDKYVFTDIDNKSYVIFSNDLTLKVEKNLRKYWAPMVYEVKPMQRIIGRGGTPDEIADQFKDANSGKGCANAPGCDAGTLDMICMFTIIGEYRCALTEGPNSPCPSQVLSHTAGDLFDYAYIPDLMYSFRNDFLSEFEIGRKYIDYYYYLGEEWKGNLNIELAIKTASVLIDFNSVMSAFLAPDEHMNDIMLTPELSTSLLNLLDSYETITNSSEGKQILNSIRADINLFGGKTLEEILIMIK
jgi:hypothetical protein